MAADSRNFELATANRQLIATQDRRKADAVRPDVDLARDARPCDDGETVGPDPSKWTKLDALWVTVRYHVPIISVIARDDVVPTDDRNITPAFTALAEFAGARKASDNTWSWYKPWSWSWTQNADEYRACRNTVRQQENPGPAASRVWPTNGVWLTPEDWFQIMALLNWIMWPILLTAIIRRLVVKED